MVRIYLLSCRGYQGWSKGRRGIFKGMLYRVADTEGGLRGRGIVRVTLYRVADTKGGLRGRGYC